MTVSYPWLKTYPAHVAWDTPLTAVPLPQLLDDAAARFGDRLCLDFLGKTYSYAAVADLVARAAFGLQQRGVKKGDKVGLMLPNTPYYVVMYFALLKLGAVVVNFNPLYAAREVAHQIKDSGCTIMVTLDLKLTYDKLLALLDMRPLARLIVCPMADILPWPQNWLFPLVKRRDLATVSPDARHIFFADLVAKAGCADLPGCDPQRDLAVLQYTGGTTGVPKAAMLTHANLSINAQQACLWFGNLRPGEERILGVLPFFHVFAMTCILNVGIRLGAAIIMLPRFDLAQVIRTIHKKKPTMFPAVPTIYTAINHYKDLARFDLSSIRYCISGGAGLPVEVKHAFEKLTGCTLVEGYGLSETSPVTHANPITGANKAGSIGLPLPQTVVEIMGLEERTQPAPRGERGEVCIRGPQVMAGYWNNRAETDNVLLPTDDGGFRLHTGDVGVMDEDGYVFIVDRIKDMILCGGYNVYPRVVEEAIYLHAAVEECIVVGVADEYRGQTVKAYVKLRDGMTLDKAALIAFLRDKLSPIEMPKQVVFRTTPLPRTQIGKLSRKLLLEQEAAGG